MTDVSENSQLKTQRQPLPAPQVRERLLDKELFSQAQQLGLSSLQANIIARRWRASENLPLSHLITPSLQQISPPTLLRDGLRAASRIVQALKQKQKIAIVTDYDVDGISSHYLIQDFLQRLPIANPANLQSFIGHRLKDGYGLSENLVKQILIARPALVITADCGSSDQANIAYLRDHYIDVIVSDHHALPLAGIPKAAYAVINPQRPDCQYPDKTIAGCMVAWLLMALVRQVLIEQKILTADFPKLSAWLPWVALATVADCVDIGRSITNRAVINAGLQLMNQLISPCWRVMALRLKQKPPFTAESLAFQMGPRINARSRLADPFAALYFLAARQDAEAEHYLTLLEDDNQQRKIIEAQMLQQAYQQAQQQYDNQRAVLIILLTKGHSGVQGIVAARVTQAFNRPTFVFTPISQDELTASGRSIAGIALAQLLQQFDMAYPNVLRQFGGHHAAAGLTIVASGLAIFSEFINEMVYSQQAEMMPPMLLTDGELATQAFNLITVAEIASLAPFGQGLPAPVFHNQFIVHENHWLGEQRQHLSLQLQLPGQLLPAIWFNAKPFYRQQLFASQSQINVVFRLQQNEFRQRKHLQLIVEYAQLLA